MKKDMTPKSEAYNIDCMELMRRLPDRAFALAVADPPYGLDPSATQGAGKLRQRVLNQGNVSRWDVAPSEEFFRELRRVSERQIIWGGNYFALPPSRCWIAWDKVQPWENFSQVELAWTSMEGPAQLFRYDNRTGDKIHPTQKPTALYLWLLRKYAPKGGTVFDPMMGSQSSRIAAWALGLDYVGCEIDPGYFRSGQERFDRECHGISRQKDGRVIREPTLFENEE